MLSDDGYKNNMIARVVPHYRPKHAVLDYYSSIEALVRCVTSCRISRRAWRFLNIFLNALVMDLLDPLLKEVNNNDTISNPTMISEATLLPISINLSTRKKRRISSLATAHEKDDALTNLIIEIFHQVFLPGCTDSGIGRIIKKNIKTYCKPNPGLSFQVSQIRNYLKSDKYRNIFLLEDYNRSEMTLFEKVSISLTILLETVCATILDLNSRNSFDHTISLNHLYLAVRSDDELSSAFIQYFSTLDTIPLGDYSYFPNERLITRTRCTGFGFSFTDLPSDIHYSILNCCQSVEQLLNMRLVCKLWNNFIVNPRNTELWKNLSYRAIIASNKYPHCTSNTFSLRKMESMMSADTNWYDFFMEKIYKLEQVENELIDAHPKLVSEDYLDSSLVSSILLEPELGGSPFSFLNNEIDSLRNDIDGNTQVVTGSSHLGGYPDMLPGDNLKADEFLLQLNLQDLRSCITHGGMLPDSGLLLIFYSYDDKYTMRYYSEEQLPLLEMNTSLYSRTPFTRVDIREGLTCAISTSDDRDFSLFRTITGIPHWVMFQTQPLGPRVKKQFYHRLDADQMSTPEQKLVLFLQRTNCRHVITLPKKDLLTLNFSTIETTTY